MNLVLAAIAYVFRLRWSKIAKLHTLFSFLAALSPINGRVSLDLTVRACDLNPDRVAIAIIVELEEQEGSAKRL